MENQVLFAFGLALFAALAMGIGSLLAFVIRRDQTQWLSLGLGFSGGGYALCSFNGFIAGSG